MKKLLLFLILISMFFNSNAQYNESAPWMINLIKKKSSHSKKMEKPNFTFKEITDAFNEYWKDKDIHQKGNGYMPFKRWEYNMRSYVQKDGTLMRPEQKWKSWEQKKKIVRNEESNWHTTGPYTTVQKKGQGRVNTFIVDPNNPNTFYVGAPAGGIWKSTDAGKNWLPMSDKIPQIGVSAIAIDPNNSNIIYIGTGDDDGGHTQGIGIMKSIDGGKTWYKTNSTMREYVSEIYIHPSNSNILWASSWAGFFKSTDAGENLKNIKQSGQTNQIISVRDIKLKPDNPDTIYAVTRNEFWKSTDGGESFNLIKNGLPDSSSRLAIAVSPANQNLIFVLSASEDGSFQGLYKSVDSGNNFTKTNAENFIGGWSQVWYNMVITVSPTNSDIVNIGAVHFFQSTDGGNSFQLNYNIYSGESSFHADVHFLGYFNNKLYAGNDGGIYESINNGNTFNDLSEGLNISQFYKISIPKGTLTNVLGGLQDNGGFLFKDEIWHQLHGGDGMDNAMYKNSYGLNFNFSFTQNGENFMIFNGDEFSSNIVPPNGETGYWVTPLQLDNGGIPYVGFQNLYKTEDYENWQKVSDSNFNDGANLINIEISPTDDNVIYTTTFKKIYKSIDKGKTFTQVILPSNSIYDITSIEISNQNSDIIYISVSDYSTTPTHTIYKSTNGGVDWMELRENLPNDDRILVIKHQDKSLKNDLYLGTILGVYHTNDDMDGWERFDNNLPNVPVKDLEINIENNTITAATFGRGIWISPLANSSALAIDKFESSSFRIYPNPSNSFITIKNKENDNIVEVKIFDIMGRELKTITKNTSYIDISSLSNGIYFIKLKTDKGETSKKLIIND